MRRILRDLFFPPRCPFCGRVLDAEAICPDCQEGLPWLVGRSAQRRPEHIELCVSPLRYEGLVRPCVHRYKFRRRRGYARVLGPLCAQCVHDHMGQRSFDLVSWPPLSPKGLKRRGFDQARLLARAVAESLGTEETPLFQKRETAQQSSLRAPAARRANVLAAFTLLDPELVRGKTILLVDDVVTTGSTLSECARVLLTAGAEEVWAVTLASAKGSS